MQETTIAGNNHIGIPVKLLGRETKEMYKRIVAAHRRQNYWATEVLTQLKSLDSGHYKDNIYRDMTVQKAEMLLMTFSGCTVRILRRTNGEYAIFKIEVNPQLLNDYGAEQQSKGQQGIYKVTLKADGSVENTEFTRGGAVTAEKGRVIVISDRHPTIEAAASEAANVMDPVLGSNTMNDIKNESFDLFYTHGKKRIGGALRLKEAANPEQNIALFEPAAQLANTMRRAQNIQNAAWVTVRGGAGVFTHSTNLLRHQKLNFSDSKQKAYFGEITTNVVKAEQHARECGFTVEKDKGGLLSLDMARTFGSGAITGGALHAAMNRFRADPEGSILKLTGDISREVTAGKGVFETTQKVAAAVMPVVGISAGAAGTLSPGAAFIVTASAAVLPLGDALVKAWLPDFYARMKRKF
ncbi:hypothetical protein [Marinibactrum halimedae]|uniref:Uncharacterized protein n=1 Tax=Marinibactrum halimedae TaxID=1444977 RepID=A0AA37T8E7_9GAMM|nr:hypothetical protein [Marinibactrum halimedae]MCD9459706.1 hypothetical protein [Marinibactrum halimedae]GLS24537.1 hypothetical protein GCM10007877_02490 [Marinibactrum halimedae]